MDQRYRYNTDLVQGVRILVYCPANVCCCTFGDVFNFLKKARLFSVGIQFFVCLPGRGRVSRGSEFPKRTFAHPQLLKRRVKLYSELKQASLRLPREHLAQLRRSTPCVLETYPLPFMTPEILSCKLTLGILHHSYDVIGR